MGMFCGEWEGFYVLVKTPVRVWGHGQTDHCHISTDAHI